MKLVSSPPELGFFSNEYETLQILTYPSLLMSSERNICHFGAAYKPRCNDNTESLWEKTHQYGNWEAYWKDTSDLVVSVTNYYLFQITVNEGGIQ